MLSLLLGRWGCVLPGIFTNQIGYQNGKFKHHQARARLTTFAIFVIPWLVVVCSTRSKHDIPQGGWKTEKKRNGRYPCSRNASLCLYCPFEMLQATGRPNGEGVSVI